MQRVIRCLLMALLCLSLCASALADAQLLPELTEWNWTVLPVEVNLAADVRAHQPFDDNRTAQLNAMLKHMTLQLRYQDLEGERWSRASLLLDGDSVITATQRETGQNTEAQFSCMPEATYAWSSGSGMNIGSFLGAEAPDGTIFGLDASGEAWLSDARAFFDALCQAMPDRLKSEKSGASIKNMGKAAEKQVLTIPKSAVDESLGETLAQLCPEGAFRELIGSLTFSGKQVMTLWRTADGDIIRADWSGKAGVSKEDMRTVSLTWRMLRSDEAVRDDLTLKTPKAAGSGRNNIVFTRALETDGGETSLDMELRYEVLASGDKTVVTGDIDLTRTDKDGAPYLSGEIELSQQLPDAEETNRYVIAPALSFTGSANAPALEGVVNVKQYRDRSLMEDADVSVTVGPSDWIDWELRSSVIMVDQSADADALRQRVLDGATVDLVRRLVLLPQEDALFLSADIDPAVWQQIVEAAQSALQ